METDEEKKMVKCSWIYKGNNHCTTSFYYLRRFQHSIAKLLQ